jgi:Holliday junction resolvase RusA-like endonuclease
MSNNAILFTGIPIPPSQNGQYVTIMHKGKQRRIKSKESQDWAREFEKWAIINVRTIIEAKNTIALWNSRFIEVSVFAGFKYERMVCKDGSPKKLDISNRLKALHDLIAEKIKMDDCTFVRTPAEKCIAVNEEVIILIRPMTMRTLSDVRTLIFAEFSTF